MIHSTEAQLREHGDKLAGDDKQAIEAALADCKSATEGDDADAIRQKTEALAQAAMKIGEAMYQSGGGDEAGGGGGGGEAGGETGGSADEGVVDADFEEVDDDKNSKSA